MRDLPPVMALTLRRPWGHGIVHRTKRVECRTWNTEYRGIVAVHSGLGWDAWAAERFPILADLADHDVPTGFIGAARLVAVCTEQAATLPGRGPACTDPGCDGWAMRGCYHWQLDRVVAFTEPIPGGGRLGLWTPPRDVAEAAGYAMRYAA